MEFLNEKKNRARPKASSHRRSLISNDGKLQAKVTRVTFQYQPGLPRPRPKQKFTFARKIEVRPVQFKSKVGPAPLRLLARKSSCAVSSALALWSPFPADGERLGAFRGVQTISLSSNTPGLTVLCPALSVIFAAIRPASFVRHCCFIPVPAYFYFVFRVVFAVFLHE